MSDRAPPASDESSILRDVRWGTLECDEAVKQLLKLGCDYAAACDAVAEAMAQLEHRQ